LYIIDKNKDFYDYFSHVYGIDKSVVFDRRGSCIMDDRGIYETLDRERPHYFHKRREELYFMLEIADTQYLVKFSDFVFKKMVADDTFVKGKMEIVRVFKDNHHYHDSLISIRGFLPRFRWKGWKKIQFMHEEQSTSFDDCISKFRSGIINLPILANTQLTSLLNPEEIWKELQNYISAKNNDKNVDIEIADVEKAINHGFDKKTSFRHPVK